MPRPGQTWGFATFFPSHSSKLRDLLGRDSLTMAKFAIDLGLLACYT